MPNSLSGIATQIALGGGLFYGVVKFFDTIGDRLNENTRLEIAVWLLDAKARPHVKNWLDTIVRVFFSICADGDCESAGASGRRRAAREFRAASFLGAACWAPATLPVVIDLYLENSRVMCPYTAGAMAVALLTCILLGWLVLRVANGVRKRLDSPRQALPWMTALFVACLAAPVLVFRIEMCGRFLGVREWPAAMSASLARWWVSALLAISIASAALWITALSGLLLKLACRVDGLLKWLNDHMDIEKKPLQSIGVVAGALVALVYWGAAAVIR